jgi:HAD superfamily hydrolase (TIGR01549 family)
MQMPSKDLSKQVVYSAGDEGGMCNTLYLALKALQKEKPAYEQGSQSWWADVIKRTALGAGADARALDESLEYIVPSLMKRFSSGEGYKEFEDAIPTIGALYDRQIYTAVLSNSDSRSRAVLTDLKFPEYVAPIVLSEEEGIEKPAQEMFMRTLERVSSIRGERIRPEECVHVGDELEADYRGATRAGMRALLLRRSGVEGEDLNGVKVIEELSQVLDYAC